MTLFDKAQSLKKKGRLLNFEICGLNQSRRHCVAINHFSKGKKGIKVKLYLIIEK